MNNIKRIKIITDLNISFYTTTKITTGTKNPHGIVDYLKKQDIDITDYEHGSFITKDYTFFACKGKHTFIFNRDMELLQRCRVIEESEEKIRKSPAIDSMILHGNGFFYCVGRIHPSLLDELKKSPLKRERECMI